MNFTRDSLEKVFRLVDILEYLHANPLTANTLALKGGTAINLTIFDLPRLSVDIDLDYVPTNSREQMMAERESIVSDVRVYMATEGYALSQMSKTRHSLDSLIFTYRNLGGTNDNLKIEINYSLRAHLFEPKKRAIITRAVTTDRSVLSVVPVEIYAGKTNALLSRSAPRDLYDVYNMVHFGLFDDDDRDLLRKSAVFYTAISQDRIPEEYSFERLNSITNHKIRTDLIPVLQKGVYASLEDMKAEVKEYLAALMRPTKEEKAFLSTFGRGEYRPELLFSGDILERIRNHPMAMWKMRQHTSD